MLTTTYIFILKLKKDHLDDAFYALAWIEWVAFLSFVVIVRNT